MTAAAANQNIPLHHRKYGQKDPTRRMIGWGVVIAIHALIMWALITGTARDALKIIKKPLEAAVIQEVIIPPPPPPPPPKEIVKPTPKLEAPPPPFIPPPEVKPPETSAPVIPSVTTPPPAPPVIAPPPPPAAPPAPSGRQEMGVACPTQTKPEMPRQALRDGTTGLVRAQALIRDGRVVSVDILSGPRIFHAAVREAMMQYKCITTTGGDIVATQEFNFKQE
ncbi:energy transducer TonB [Ramlibacter sp. PS4R-6]|uniref:energy transducer TonB n=1 Tax=Ramlibacter sp. PS4R-6 TaxID=3133438 RepID=UPI0030AA2D9C